MTHRVAERLNEHRIGGESGITWTTVCRICGAKHWPWLPARQPVDEYTCTSCSSAIEGADGDSVWLIEKLVERVARLEEMVNKGDQK